MSDATKLVIWWSPDGHDWTNSPLDLAQAPVLPAQLIPIGDRLALLGAVLDTSSGQGILRPAVWASENLTDWRRTDLGLTSEASVPAFIAYGPKGYIALAGDRLWFAEDGFAWQRSSDIPAVSGVVAGGDGFVAVSSGERSMARIFASADGLIWYEGDTLPGWALSVAAVGGEWVATGGKSDFGVWTSEDGLSWAQSTSIRDLSGFSSGVGIATEVTYTPMVTVDDDVYMTLAWNHCCVQLSGGRGVYRSSDGATWRLLEFADAVVQAGATDGETVVLGGHGGRGAEGVLWVSN
jgi:hypothetical protein